MPRRPTKAKSPSRRAGPGAQLRSRPATKGQLVVVAEQEQLLERVHAALRRAACRPLRGRAGGGGEFESLREELFQAREDDVGLVLALMHQQAARDGTAALDVLPDADVPYFAHLRVRTGDRLRDILLGSRSLPGLAPGLSIVDWRTAPIAEVFFTCREGDDYEVGVAGRSLAGVVEARHVVTFEEGRLATISVADGTLRRAIKRWHYDPAPFGLPLTGAPDAPLAKQLVGATSSGTMAPLAAELLDPQQQALLDRDPDQALLILGSAGCGKTTVALHRVARLCARWPDRFPARRTLVVVPERGLRGLGERLLDELDLDPVVVRTFDEWVGCSLWGSHSAGAFPSPRGSR